MLLSTDLVFSRRGCAGGVGGGLRLAGVLASATGPSRKAVSTLKLEPASLRSLLSPTLPRLALGSPAQKARRSACR